MRPLVSRFLMALFLTVVSAIAKAEAPSKVDPYQPIPYVKLQHPEWSKNATLYQLNTRQFTQEGTFRAAEKHLPRIKALNVDIIWLMPIHPIGVKNRKGPLGSPYSVKDYLAVNPEFGTLEDFKHFVDTAHGLGMKVILDWVANHTAWDNPLVSEHPDWYQRNWKGDFRPTPWWDWSDIINLDYSQPGLRKYMTEALKYWVRDVGVDGYRCDVAGFVPVDFWNNARKELDAIKPVFMLAEWETRDLMAEAFDMTYGWSWYEAVEKVAKGKSDLGALFNYYSWRESFYPADGYRMTFVSNHDKNSWEGTGPETFGPALNAAIVLSVVGDGMPLLYGGQEAGETKRLKFFERDPIVWKEHPVAELYRKLFALKKANTTLWNGHWGALMVDITNNARSEVLSFVRSNEHDKVFAVINFSRKAQKVKFEESLCHGHYVEYFSGKAVEISQGTELKLEPWGYQIFVQKSR